MKYKNPKKSLLFCALFVSILALAYGQILGQTELSTAAIFSLDDQGNQVDEKGNVWHNPDFNYSAANDTRAREYFDAATGRHLVLTKMMRSDPVYPPTCALACAKITGSNGLPMKCVDAVSSFPYLGTAGGKVFYPHANVLFSEFPGHGAHGTRSDSICLNGSHVAKTGACAGTVGDTISTCASCGKNIDINESVAPPSDFSDGVVVACAESSFIENAPVNDEEDEEVNIVAIEPIVSSTVVDEAFVVEVGPGQTGTSQCAREGKICLGGSLTNRRACKDFYPHAIETNKTEGYASDFKCTGGSLQVGAPCEGTLEDTCAVAASAEIFECDEVVKTGVDVAMVECSEPFTEELLNEVGGFIPPISTPQADPNTGFVPYAVTVSHPLQQSTTVTVYYQKVGTQEQLIASLDPSIAAADVSEGEADQDTNLEPQIGSVDRIDTNDFDEVVVSFNWDPSQDLADIMGEYVLVVKVTDETGNTTTDVSPVFTLDDTGAGPEIIVLEEIPEDIDGDGLLNEVDPDIDGDGVANVWDLDVDGDGDTNGQDSDDDSDGISDSVDDTPTGIGTVEDIDGDDTVNGDDDDIDGDGLLNAVDPDIDGDGIPNGQDSDIDGDGIPNEEDSDMDGDGLLNGQDPDVDGDGLDNGEDPDVDADAVLNGEDPDVDGDGVANGDDPDVDGDGIDNADDLDIDGDGIPNEIGLTPDPDIDGDATTNIDDMDVDADGTLNGEDPDVDADGVLNGEDPDVDGDGIPNELDGDIDGDGIPNALDGDIDGDGLPNEEDPDSDGDAINDDADSSPRGRDTSVGTGNTDDTGLKGSAMNCFEEGCTQGQKKEFFEDLIEKSKGGLITDVYQGVQKNIVEFIVRLYEQGYSLEELTQDSLSRALAISISAEVLKLRGNIVQESLDAVTESYYSDVSNDTERGRTINALTAIGIVNGYPDGNFYEERASNLVEGAKVIVNTAALVSASQVGSVLQNNLMNADMMDWFFPFLKTLEELNIRFIADQITGYQDYEVLGLEMDIINFLLLFDKLSEVIGIDDILSSNPIGQLAT